MNSGDLWRFKWRAASYFFAATFSAFAGALVTGDAGTSLKDWLIAGALALGAGFGALKALFDQKVDTTPPPEPDPPV